MSAENMNLTLKVWRQPGPDAPGELKTYPAKNISPHVSFLEMLDQVNQELVLKGEEPIAFEADCREGICGACSLMINGQAHGPDTGCTVCQLHMRHFSDGDTIFIEPWRAKAFPVIKDLAVDRTALDRIITAGGYVSVNSGGAPNANSIPIPKENAERSMDAASCIGCGACVASCKNASAMLFVSAKVSQFALLPQGRTEAARRALRMVEAMDAEGFGSCTNESECESACPKSISVSNIARLNREFLKAGLAYEPV